MVCRGRSLGLLIVCLLCSLTALSQEVPIQDNADDGTEVNGLEWYPGGFKAGRDYLGRGPEGRFGVGFRFHLDDCSMGEKVAYARLGFSSFGGEISSSAKLIIEGVLQESPTSFSKVERPSQKLPKTSRKVVFDLGETWDAGSDEVPLHYFTPDLSPLINEILALPGWGSGGEGKTLILTIRDASEPYLDNYVKFDDYCKGGSQIKSFPARLELFKTVYDTFLGEEFLSRPTDRSITLCLYSLIPTDLYVEYGPSPGSYPFRSGFHLDRPPEQAVQIVLRNLSPNTRYYYRLVYRRAGTRPWETGPERTFHTRRSIENPYSVAVMADEHLQNLLMYPVNKQGLELYRTTIENIALDQPDFLISLGDFAGTQFTKGRNAANTMEAKNRYLDQREMLDPIAHSIPFFLTLGNHEGEEAWYYDFHKDKKKNLKSLPVISLAARKDIAPNPHPDGFYKGDPEVAECLGYREDYFAWEWGDALFVVLSPYWYTLDKPIDGWGWTLGRWQYDWLYETLHRSEARWKLVFIHHLTSTSPSIDPPNYGRGGTEVAKHKVAGLPSFEWGGEDDQGDMLFAQKRPGWSHGPVHDLLVSEGVAVLFHGHDHLFAKQDLDGMVYQECPQPADATYSLGFKKDGCYASGTLIKNSGYLRVTVDPEFLQVDYIRSYLPGDGDNGEIAATYRIE